MLYFIDDDDMKVGVDASRIVPDAVPSFGCHNPAQGAEERVVGVDVEGELRIDGVR